MVFYILHFEFSDLRVSESHVTSAVRRSTGQHYSTILARSFDINNSAFKLASKLAWNWRTNRITPVPCQFLTSSMTVSGYYQVTVMVPSWILKSHAQKIGQNYGIMSAKISHEFTAPPVTIFFTQLQHLERQSNRWAPHPYLLSNKSQRGKSDPIFRTY